MKKPNLRNNRYAFEWFVREQDKSYWKMTQRLVKQRSKKTTALTIISTVAIEIIFSTLIFRMIRKLK
ncbi:hypothetical protein [uncultured Robinsoniella sp.]|uniref:hypothetical protein n=1 Tax=uncultured Robinsoniella sp. TaxID=904190 RepID=UPI00290B6B27|nr:hypothetical protein [Clostridiales bacterium]